MIHDASVVFPQDDARDAATWQLGYFDALEEGVVRFLPDLRLTIANAAFCRLLHMPPHLADRAQSLYLPDVVRQRFAEVIATITPEAPLTQVEHQVLSPEGTAHWVQWDIRGIVDAAGQVVAYQAVGHDTTARKDAEAQMREREERYRAIVANAAMGICLVDEYGQFLECNPAVVRMTGIQPSMLAMLTLSQLTEPDDWEREAPLFRDVWDGTIPEYRIEKRLVTDTGMEEWVSATTTVVRDAAGAPKYAVQLMETITARKTSERLLQEYHEKLRAMAVSATLAEERERRRLAQELHDQIGQSLAISRLQLGKLLSVHPAQDPAIDAVRDILSEALDYSRTLISELSPPVLHELGLVPGLRWLARHISERYHIPTELQVSCCVPDFAPELRTLLFNVIRELLINVVKHANANRAILRVEAEWDAVTVIVEDDGCGIPHKPDGTAIQEGFGLFSVRERIEQIGGVFTIDPMDGPGARCRIRVPVPEPVEEE